MKPRQRDLFIYKLLDYAAALLAWFLFFIYRKYVETGIIDWAHIVQDRKLYYGLLLIPIIWMLAYSLFDHYKDVYRLSRIATFNRTVALSFFGVIILFFTILMDDIVLDYVSYVRPFLILFVLHCGLTALLRLSWLTFIKSNLKTGKVVFKTAIIGSGATASQVLADIRQKPYQLGHEFIGFISNSSSVDSALSQQLTPLGHVDNLNMIIQNNQIEDVIIATENPHEHQVQDTIQVLASLDQGVVIKVVPDMFDIMLGNVKMTHIYGAPFIEVQQELMPRWQWVIKRSMDIVISLLGLIMLSPVLLLAAWFVKRETQSSIIFRQERIGYQGEPFTIFKFRSMIADAEKDGPQLSHDHDERVTPWGRTMRKWRIDELPQLWNVLIGDMSLVGPRPERQYYIDQLTAEIPYYKKLLKVRPGVTSWGQVKYGYASNLEEMKQRLRFDILYLENMSIALDIKILFYTVLVIIQGKGK